MDRLFSELDFRARLLPLERPVSYIENTRALLGRLIEEGPIPAVHGVVRCQACDLIIQLHEDFGSRTTRSTAL